MERQVPKHLTLVTLKGKGHVSLHYCLKGKFTKAYIKKDKLCLCP